MVLVHQAFAIINVIFTIGTVVAENFIIVSFDDPTPASHLDSAVIISGRTVAAMNASNRWAKNVLGKSNNIACAKNSITSETNRATAAAVNVVIAHDAAFPEAPRMHFGRAIVPVFTVAGKGCNIHNIVPRKASCPSRL